eukprot:TRINITY_DN21675_c0_g1_i1.p1 TRINITY_DN21675_c0_g1~~TRINITY_DN21675_c0_g1_i1.p1  ORF type:complete len:299 (-),score=49.10 TRINITY_DN21675_c0_g1_i1:140-1036(-)
MLRLPPRSTLSSSSAASDVYKRQGQGGDAVVSVPVVVGRVIDATIAQLMPNMLSFTSILQEQQQQPSSISQDGGIGISGRGRMQSPRVALAMLCGLPGSGKTTLSGQIGSTFQSSSSDQHESSNLLIHVERDHFFAAEQAKIRRQRFGATTTTNTAGGGGELSTRDMKLAQRRAHKAVVIACRRASNISLGLTTTMSTTNSSSSSILSTPAIAASHQQQHHRQYDTAVVVLDACNATIAARRHWRSEFPFQLNHNRIGNPRSNQHQQHQHNQLSGDVLKFALVFLDCLLYTSPSPRDS